MTKEELIDLISDYFGVDPFDGNSRPTKDDLVRLLRSLAS